MTNRRTWTALLLALLSTACASIPTYGVSLGMEMLPTTGPGGGLIDPPVLGPATTYLASRGYATTRLDGMGPVLTMERRADSTADRISILEGRHEGDPSGWITIEVAARSYIVTPAAKYIAIKPSAAVRADADSLIARLKQP